MNTRRRFLETCAKAGFSLPAAAVLGGTARAGQLVPSRSPLLPEPRDRSRVALDRFADLRRHFLFEYYPWYGGPPDHFHWSSADREPPLDLASNYYPRLGPYDVRLRTTVERHARWIAESGVGAVNLSWWGVGSFENQAVHTVMDVMRDHDIKVAFHLEPYSSDRGLRFASDVLYLLREYGDKRRWDTFLILQDASGRSGPVFKGFATILPSSSVDCHGVDRPVPEYTRDDTWRRGNDDLRGALRRDFDHVTFLADSAHFERVQASGFDGVAFYDPFVRPDHYRPLAERASAAGLVSSFAVNPGFDVIRIRQVDPDSCYTPAPFEPAATPPIDWSSLDDRDRAARLSRDRIVESFRASLAVQTDGGLVDAQRGFFLVYITTFNEWHEGTQFEPMKSDAELTREERALGYHNPSDGDYRLKTLRSLLAEVVPRQVTRSGRD